MQRLFAALCLLIASALSAHAQDNPIIQRMQDFAEAYNVADAAAVATFYTEDAALLAPATPALVGRDAIQAHYTAAFEAGVKNLRFEIKEIRAHGPSTAIEIGETLVDAGAQTIHGRYLHVWTLSDGTWLLSRDIYHLLASN